MTPARSLAASVIALGFASSLTAPLPAFAAPSPCGALKSAAPNNAAPNNAAPSYAAPSYAAQSGAQMLRIDRLAWHRSSDRERPSIKSAPSTSARHQKESVTDTASGLLGPDADLTSGGLGDSGQGVTGFLSGTGDLAKSIANGSVTAAGGPLSAVSGGGQSGGQPGAAPLSAVGGGQGGGGPVTESSDDSSAIGGVGVGETKTAMIANARTNAVAVGRMADAKGSLSQPLIQAAPPNSADASRHTSPWSAGPLGIGAGELAMHAAWDPAMACGKKFGDAARSTATLKRFGLLDGDLIRVPDTIASTSWTSLAPSGGEARSVATATMTAGHLSLADGRIKVQVLHPPTLIASMGTGSGGAVVYKPAQVKVTWPGGSSKTLNTAGDSVDVSLSAERSAESAGLGSLPTLDGLVPASALPLPSVPGLPSVATPDTESAPAAGNAVTVRVSLGEAHQATKGHAIAAKVSAIQIAIAEGRTDDSDYRSPRTGSRNGHGTDNSSENGPGDGNSGDSNDNSSKAGDRGDGSSKGSGKNGYGQDRSSGTRGHDGYGDISSSVVAEMSLGLLEAAAVAPAASQNDSGVGGSAALPITGPQAGLFAAAGLALLVAGGAAVLIGRRRRRTLP